MDGLADAAKISPHIQELLEISNPETVGFVFTAGLQKVHEKESMYEDKEERLRCCLTLPWHDISVTTGTPCRSVVWQGS